MAPSKLAKKTREPATEEAATPRQKLATALVEKVPNASLSWKFGNASLTIDDKVFAFPSGDGGVVMKLPEDQIQALVAAGSARPLVMGKRTMREWAVVPNPASAATLKLLRAAAEFVVSLPKMQRKPKKK